MFLGFTWLMLLTFMQSGPAKAVLAFPFLGLLAIASLASLSSKLFVLQAVLPAVFCYAVSTSFGLEGRWHSRTLKASTNWQLRFSSVAENGHANPWDQGKWEFRERFSQRRVSNYMAVIAPKSFYDKASQWFGRPTRRLPVDHTGAFLWIYVPPHANQAMLAFIRADLQLLFRTECVSRR
jgi:hypothetical protein